MLIEHRGKAPAIAETASVAPTAVVCGDVTVGAGTHIGYGAVVLAEGRPVVIGEQTVVRDGAVIRSTERHAVHVGDHVLVGPHATLFGCTVEDEAFLATGVAVFHDAVVKRRAEVRINGIVHLRTVVAEGAVVPIGWIAVGDPAEILPPSAHDRIWQLQEPLDFPGTVYGLPRRDGRRVDMRDVTARLCASAATHDDDHVI